LARDALFGRPVAGARQTSARSRASVESTTMHDSLRLLVFLPMFAEGLLLLVHPQWLARLAFLALSSERWFMLPEPKRAILTRSTYRDHPNEVTQPIPLSIAPGRVSLDGAVLFGDPATSSYALRRAFGLIRRTIWLVRIEATHEGRAVTLRAKEAFVPIALPFFMLAFLGHDLFGAPFSMFVGGVIVVVFYVQRALLAESRDAAIERAFEHIERVMIDAVDA
jgi:hypothetical protein